MLVASIGEAHRQQGEGYLHGLQHVQPLVQHIQLGTSGLPADTVHTHAINKGLSWADPHCVAQNIFQSGFCLRRL